jgi:hypothetical protein
MGCDPICQAHHNRRIREMKLLEAIWREGDDLDEPPACAGITPSLHPPRLRFRLAVKHLAAGTPAEQLSHREVDFKQIAEFMPDVMLNL